MRFYYFWAPTHYRLIDSQGFGPFYTKRAAVEAAKRSHHCRQMKLWDEPTAFFVSMTDVDFQLLHISQHEHRLRTQ